MTIVNSIRQQQPPQEQQNETSSSATPAHSNDDWMRLQHLTRSNNLGVAAMIQESSDTKKHQQQQQQQSVSTDRRSLEAFTHCLKGFQPILCRNPLATGAAAGCMEIDYEESAAMVCMSFAEHSLQDDNTGGHYWFKYPIVYYPQFNEGSTTTTTTTTTTSRPHQNEQPHEHDHQDLGDSWTGPTSINALVSCTIFNMALLLHKRGMTENRSEHLKKASKLYELAIELFLGDDNSSKQEDLEDEYCNSTSRLLVLLQMACWNNRSHIYYHQGEFEYSQACLERVAILAERGAPPQLVDDTNADMDIDEGRTFVLARAEDSRNQHNSAVVDELWSGALLNAFLLRTQPTLAAAA